MRIGELDLNQRVMVAAEIGNNHEGSYSLAQEMILRAAQAGVDAVKFQTIVPERLVSPGEEKRLAMLRRFQLSYEQFARLQEVATNAGVLFLSTPFDLQSAGFLAPLVPAFKIASGDNNFFPLIDVIARTGKPIILSAGLADLEDVRRTKGFIERIWTELGVDPGLAVLHCVVSYPTPAKDANLLAIRKLASLGVTVGYSDHTVGIEAAVLSVACGARIIEKHFTISKTYSDFRDHRLSADPSDMADLVRRVRLAEEMLGSQEKRMLEAEQPLALATRRSIVAARDLPAGTVLKWEHLDWLRPGGGLAPGRESELLGRRLACPVAKGKPLMPDHLQP
ncbi:MAG TPA: N-acetylneuraminate synthase family protein [Phycisphaerae bacterium]|nr:N-acetylneuraminate synthase family protein [Phycisphaerae bacterium]HRR86466.1 N-acetylneuraminate synthase family protein [Phycisphaerae bacterium]